MQKPSNITKHELIGLDVKVVESKNKSETGIQGTVIDETRNMLLIKKDGKAKKVVKKNSKFMFTLPDSRKVIIDGNLLVGKPEARIQKRMIKKRV
jgi:ribonuclease P protein subunit POP4